MRLARTALIVCSYALGLGATSAQEVSARAGVGLRPAMPSQDVTLIMMRSSLMMIGQANLANNYSVLRALASKSFRDKNSEE